MRHQRAILDALVKDMLAQTFDHIVITGDITNISLPAEFRQASEWLATLGTSERVTIVPGNHDAYLPPFRDQGFWHWKPYLLDNEEATRFLKKEKIFEEGKTRQPFPFLRLFNNIALIGLSTAVPTFPAMAIGRLGKKQIKALGELLGCLGKAGYARIVLIHHPPLPNMTTFGRGLMDAKRLRDILQAQGVELVLYGHNHVFRIDRLGAENGAIPIVGAASASLASDTLERRARYNLLTIAKAGCDRWEVTLRSRMFNGDDGFREFDHGVL
jgi:3',5'-cyclic AMP phosphodiesterase CpdA